MKFGMNMLLWSDNVLDPKFLQLFERLKRMGFDGVEIPIFAPDEAKYAKLGRALDEIGLQRTVVTVSTAEANPISDSAAVRKAASDSLSAVLDSCKALGAQQLVGPYYGPLGVFTGKGPTAKEWEYGVETLIPIAQKASQMGIKLSLEFLNRFEIYFLNCAADTRRFAEALGGDHVGVLYDTFHSHIEEKNPYQAIMGCGSRLNHIHVSENDRSTPGKGQVAWAPVFKAIKDVGYDGWLTIEAFGQGLAPLAAATKIWRRMFEDEETLAREGLAFMKASIKA